MGGRVPWKDARFERGVSDIRAACGVPEHDRDDDALIGMLLECFKWDREKVIEMYKKSVTRRSELGLAGIRVGGAARATAFAAAPRPSAAAHPRARVSCAGSHRLEAA